MKVKEAIIVAGGIGKRLQKVVKEIPKPMADINGKPFLEYLLNYLTANGVERMILSIGYKADLIQDYFKNHPLKDMITYSIEDEPLGTGGGIKKALSQAKENEVLVVNGDTYFDVDIQKLFKHHTEHSAEATMALKEMEDCGRYGRVIVDEDFRTIGFEEKKAGISGMINGGVSIINSNILDNMPEVFSFEIDFLSKNIKNRKIFGQPFDGYFIDIGVPEDYERAKDEFKRL